MEVKLTGDEYKKLVSDYENICELLAKSVKSNSYSQTYADELYYFEIPQRELPKGVIKKLPP